MTYGCQRSMEGRLATHVLMDIQLSHIAAVTFTRPDYKYSIMDEGEAKVPKLQ